MRLFRMKDCYRKLEVSGAIRMAAVAIDLNSVAGALTRGAAVFTVLWWGATTHGILTGVCLVCHGILLEMFGRFGGID